MGKTRRDILKISGAALATGLAGCSITNKDRNRNTSTPNSTDTSRTDTPTDNTDTETPEPEVPESFRADRKRINSENSEPENVGDYQTEQEWDDIITDIPELRETQERVLEEQAYGPLVDQVMSGEDFSSGGLIFPNYNFEGEENDIGFFDQDAVKNEDDFETLIRWYLPAIVHYDGENYGKAPSGRNDRFAATLETLINQHHPEAEAVSTSVKAFPRHGIFGVQDKNNEEFYMVDTTATPQFEQTVGRIGDFITSENGDRSSLWDPFHEFEPGPTDYGTYEGKSSSAMTALANFVTKGGEFEIREERNGRIFITDEWMDDAYEVLRNGGSIEPIVEPIEEVIYKQRTQQKDQDIGIYGTLDDTRIAVTSDEEIYETVNYDETQTPGIEEIESMLEA